MTIVYNAEYFNSSGIHLSNNALQKNRNRHESTVRQSWIKKALVDRIEEPFVTDIGTLNSFRNQRLPLCFEDFQTLNIMLATSTMKKRPK